MVVREACPACGSKRFKRNGHLQTGQQNHQCKACGRQFVLQAANRVISEEQRTLVERLLCEKISLHGICRAVGVSIRWLMGFIVTRFAALPDHLHVLPVAVPREVLIGRLEVEADEMWSFVTKKAAPFKFQLTVSRKPPVVVGC
jgi:insertion element IS1 protein InsB